MKKFILLALIALSNSLHSSAQIEGHEIGVDGFVSASTVGGSYSFGLKYGMVMNENIVVGPSFRFQRNWSNNIGTKFGFNILGGGVFAHFRYQNAVYGGIEFEMLHSPVSYVFPNPGSNWVPTLFVGGGFSREFDWVRLNAGMYYDVINHANSPFRQSYFMKIKDATTGQVVRILPIIYRISFFFPIGR
jgi:hypothetical protein